MVEVGDFYEDGSDGNRLGEHFGFPRGGGGEIYTARDQAHRRLFELINNRRKLPIKLKGEIIYYTGPTPAKPGRVIGSAGPTTSSRMDKYTPRLLELGLAATIGKGERSQEVKDAVKRYRGIYLVSVGGAGAYLSERITRAKVVVWPELGAEAVYRLTIRDFRASWHMIPRAGIFLKGQERNFRRSK